MADIESSNILVVGGAGFVGSNLVRRLLASGAAGVTVVDNLLSSERENLPEDPRVDLIVGSIADPAVLGSLPEDGFDFIFHLATFHGNQSSIARPLEDHDNNLVTTLRLLEHVKGWGRLQKLVYAGAGCAVAEKTYDDAQATKEDAPISLSMDSPYSISKIVGEFYCEYYRERHSVPAVRARFQNVYGPGEVLGAGRWRGTPNTVWRNVTPTFIWKALHGEKLPLEGGGETSRDFIFVEDLVRGLCLCATEGTPGEAYNLASGGDVTIGRLAELINSYAGNEGNIESLPRRTWDHSGRRFGCPEKSKRELGFEAEVQVEEGLRRTVEWTRENEGFIGRCIQKHAHRLA